MKVIIECDVDFVELPFDPLAVGSCRKCTFHRRITLGGCIRSDQRMCSFGRTGYFIRNYMREVPDSIVGAKIEEGTRGTSKIL